MSKNEIDRSLLGNRYFRFEHNTMVSSYTLDGDTMSHFKCLYHPLMNASVVKEPDNLKLVIYWPTKWWRSPKLEITTKSNPTLKRATKSKFKTNADLMKRFLPTDEELCVCIGNAFEKEIIDDTYADYSKWMENITDHIVLSWMKKNYGNRLLAKDLRKKADKTAVMVDKTDALLAE